MDGGLGRPARRQRSGLQSSAPEVSLLHTVRAPVHPRHGCWLRRHGNRRLLLHRGFLRGASAERTVAVAAERTRSTASQRQQLHRGGDVDDDV